jgi:iron complex transport system substrate-binding protein
VPAYPRRIVSLSPSNTEILCALGLVRRLVGVDRWSDYPPAVARLPKVGRDLEIDLEKVAALEPDLVVACLSVPGMERNVAGMAAAGLPHISLEPAGLDSIYDNIRIAGRATGRASRAEALAAALATRLETVGARAQTADSRPRVYWEWWPKPPVAAAGTGWISRIIALAGGENVFGSVHQDTLRPSDDDVRAAAPDVIVACWCGARTPPHPAKIAARAGWEDLPAMRAGRVYTVPERFFARPGPRLADGAELLLGLLHPELATVPSPSGRGLEAQSSITG